jgi:TonB-dependent SusC/RagA subfamily outer membrane receptor
LSYGQTNVTGKVTDSKGEALIGVNVKIKDTQQGTITDIDGHFSLSVANTNQVLELSYVGFKTVEVPLSGRTSVNITLQEDTELLEEVVVVGYGTQKKISVTGAISSVSDREIERAPSVGITNVIGARVAGVSMLQSSGQPGGDAASLLVRGQKAVYIVDGVQRSFNEIDPNSIASVSVLKDATSAAVYGLDASAVVIVTTKRGKSDKMNISYNGKYGISENANQLEWLDGPSYAYWYNTSREMDGDEPVFTSEQV